MAADSDDPFDPLRAALEDAGYAELLTEVEVHDEAPEARRSRVLEALRNAVVPSMRARAASIRILSVQKVEKPLVSDALDDGQLPLVTTEADGIDALAASAEEERVQVPLATPEADDLDALADRLERAVTSLLERSDDAD